jgi:glyoxylase-like metal-dependent hydrolase (beta-lactamase superfamily II)
MPQELFPDLFRESIPLPRNPLRAVNSYIIRGDGRWLVIDTGMNRPECLDAMKAYLDSLKVDLSRTDFFITHLHVDHLGLVSGLVQSSSTVYFNRPDFGSLHDPNHWPGMGDSARINGFPEQDLAETISRHPGFRYQTRPDFEATLLGEGDILEIGEYSFECIETPGHTQGHMCLYEPGKKLLFSGDHILESITPNISLFSMSDNPLQAFIESLDKVYNYDVSHVLPGHREPFTGHRRRIDELKKHHETRCGEVLAILKKGEQSAYAVASQMTWDIDCKKWDEFPLPQKWFASGEALAHLQYLNGKGLINKETRDGKAFFY